MTRPLWLVPLICLLIILAPLWRDGLPLTQQGYLPIAPHIARDAGLQYPLAWVGTALLQPLGVGYRLLLGIGVVGAVVIIGFYSHLIWGGFGWWTAALWSSLPLTLSFIYQRGWFPLLIFVPVMLVAIFLIPAFPLFSRLSRGWQFLVVLSPVLIVTGLAVRWPYEAALSPYHWFSAAWPAPTSTREWVSQFNYQIGLVPVTLGVLTAFAAWPRRHELRARYALILLIIATGMILLTLLGGPVLLTFFIGTTALVVACGALPTLDRRYASVPVLLGLLVAAILSIYPYLQVPWIVPPATDESFFFGESELWLAAVESRQVGDQVTVTATWQTLTPPKDDYTAFVHWEDAQNTIVAQVDALLIDSDDVPTTGWPVGYIVQKQYTVTVSDSYRLIKIGLYDLDTLQRLPVNSGVNYVDVPLPQ